MARTLRQKALKLRAAAAAAAGAAAATAAAQVAAEAASAAAVVPLTFAEVGTDRSLGCKDHRINTTRSGCTSQIWEKGGDIELRSDTVVSKLSHRENTAAGDCLATQPLAAVVDLACACANYASGIFLVEAFLLV